ncbi:hypothetical protein [Streptomyces sp. NRRL S-350]|uniref:hypothetical protein n=1 Tax=Streptomyces sp. NRRL S-350 TaxID=1463902 RepID=UPI0004C03BB1|nr:hypothetical protein [Streptomyces sp. NRRL S-350]
MSPIIRPTVRHPLPEQTRVTHTAQLWAHRVPGGTGVITRAQPGAADTTEYRVLQPMDFSRRPGLDNPFGRTSQWNSQRTVPVYPQPPHAELLDQLDATYDTLTVTGLAPEHRVAMCAYLTARHPDAQAGIWSKLDADEHYDRWYCHEPAFLVAGYQAARARQHREDGALS